MYLLEFEDGSYSEIGEISKDDIKMFQDGYLTIVKFEDNHFYEVDKIIGDKIEWKKVKESTADN